MHLHTPDYLWVHAGAGGGVHTPSIRRENNMRAPSERSAHLDLS